MKEPNGNEAFLPFGSGARACIGQKLAVLGISSLFASLLGLYEVCNLSCVSSCYICQSVDNLPTCTNALHLDALSDTVVYNIGHLKMNPSKILDMGSDVLLQGIGENQNNQGICIFIKFFNRTIKFRMQVKNQQKLVLERHSLIYLCLFDS